MKLIKIIIFSALFLFQLQESQACDKKVCPAIGDSVAVTFKYFFGERVITDTSFYKDRCFEVLDSACTNFNCTDYAWYVSEGENNGRDWIENCQEDDSSGNDCGNPCTDCDKLICIPQSSIYLFKEDAYMTIDSNNLGEADYAFYFPYREKVKYVTNNHYAIVYKKGSDGPYNDTLISKWGHGRLIKHHPNNCSYWNSIDGMDDLIYYQKKIRRVDSAITTSNKNYSIGEKLLSNVTIESGILNINFFVGRLDKSMIRLEQGFKAKRGCKFHAYTKRCDTTGSSHTCRDEPARHEKALFPRQENGFNNKYNNDYCFNIFPNPATGVTAVFLKSPEKGRAVITIYDAMGRRALTTQKSKPANALEWQFETKGMKSGIYFCRVTIDGKTIGETKFIVSH